MPSIARKSFSPRTEGASPRPPSVRTPQPISQYALRVLQDDLKYKLTHNHQVLRAVSAVRDVIQGDSSYSNFKTSNFQRFSKGMRAVASHKNKVLADKYADQHDHDYVELAHMNAVLQQTSRVSRAFKVTVDANLEVWMKHHGKEMAGAESRGFTEFVKTLFDAVNEGNGYITPQGLITHIISLGLADDPKAIVTVFEGLFNTKDLSSVKLGKEQFIDMFKVKKIVDHIIEVMNAVVRSRKKESPRASVRGNLEKVMWTYPTFSQFYTVLKDWWGEVNSMRIEVVHVRKLAEFLALKAIVGNKHEGKRLILTAGQLIDEVYVRFDHYLKVFAPAMLKTCLLNLANAMSSGEFTRNLSPLRLKMAAYERKLIFEGLKSSKPNSEEKALFNAYSEFTKATKSERVLHTKERIGRVYGLSVVNKSIPKIATNLTKELERLSPIPNPFIQAASNASSDSEDAEAPIVRTSTMARNSILSNFSAEMNAKTPPKVSTKQKLFKKTQESPSVAEVRILRDTQLHEHFSEMVNFTSEFSQVLADCTNPPDCLERLYVAIR